MIRGGGQAGDTWIREAGSGDRGSGVEGEGVEYKETIINPTWKWIIWKTKTNKQNGDVNIVK